MKVYAINGGPRKGWNTDIMLKKFVEGVQTIDGIEVETVYLYDYAYTGCRSCFACLRKGATERKCYIQDDIHDLLRDVFNADGILFACPIYYDSLSAQLRGFLERLMYPGHSDKEVPTAMIHTMNVTEESMKKYGYDDFISTAADYLQNTFKSKPEVILACNTYQHKNYDDYKPTHWNAEEKYAYRQTQFPIDCQNAFDAGVRMGQRIKEKEVL